jgi:hypothetical protein
MKELNALLAGKDLAKEAAAQDASSKPESKP